MLIHCVFEFPLFLLRCLRLNVSQLLQVSLAHFNRIESISE